MSDKLIELSTNVEIAGAGIIILGAFVWMVGMAMFDIPTFLSRAKIKRQVKQSDKDT